MTQCLYYYYVFKLMFHYSIMIQMYVVMNMGYKILQIPAVLHWEETEIYELTTWKGGVLTDYINTFRLKTSYGYHNHVQTEDQKEEYIKIH